jgi:hypothetical protein
MRLKTAAIAGAACALAMNLYPQQVTLNAPDPRIVQACNRFSERGARLLPMLEQVRVQEWTGKGAPATYAAQLSTAQQQIGGIQTDMADLAGNTARMRECLKALFRVQGFHHTLDSLMGGLRKYQNPALADLIQSVAAEDAADQDLMQEYILELADQKEQEYQVVDHEAQRCRAQISREPVRNSRP